MPVPPTHPAMVFDRALVVRRRDRAAARAAAHDFLLSAAADDIVDRLSLVKRHFVSALVLGGFHGVLAARLRRDLRIPLVIEQEASPVLLSSARASGAMHAVLAAEEALPYRDGSLDLVVSALALQFVNDLPGTLVQVRRALQADGLFLATLLGGSTLTELRTALLEAEAGIEGGASPRVAPFADVRDLGGLLQRAGFALPVADSDTLTVSYATPLHLMHELRGMGATNALHLRSRKPLRRETLLRACEIYQERFSDADGRIRATFELVTMTGWAPHESQQKPLAPGSALTRLSDALRVREGGTPRGGSTREEGK